MRNGLRKGPGTLSKGSQGKSREGEQGRNNKHDATAAGYPTRVGAVSSAIVPPHATPS